MSEVLEVQARQQGGEVMSVETELEKFVLWHIPGLDSCAYPYGQVPHRTHGTHGTHTHTHTHSPKLKANGVRSTLVWPKSRPAARRAPPMITYRTMSICDLPKEFHHHHCFEEYRVANKLGLPPGLRSDHLAQLGIIVEGAPHHKHGRECEGGPH